MEFDKSKPTGADLKEARRFARLTADEAANQCGIHRTTYVRQENDTARVSLAAYKLLILLGGYIPGKEWQGWRIIGNDIWTPDNVPYSKGDIQAIFWDRQQIRGLKVDLREEKKKAELLARPSAQIIPFNRIS